jgi:hypothetical protein
MGDKGEPCVNLLEKLNRWANETPDRKAWTFLNDKGDIADSYSFKVFNLACLSYFIYLFHVIGAGSCD